MNADEMGGRYGKNRCGEQEQEQQVGPEEDDGRGVLVKEFLL